MTARNASLIANRFRPSYGTRLQNSMGTRVLGAMILLCALLLAPLASQAAAPTEGQEMEPTTRLAIGWTFSSIVFFHGQKNTEQAFRCTVFDYENPSSIECENTYGSAWQVEAKIELVRIWHSDSRVDGHRIFITRETRAGTYHYEGVLSQGGMMNHRWISGSYTVTKRIWKRSGWRRHQVTVTSGPYPFTAGVTPVSVE